MLLFESESQTVFNDHVDTNIRYTLPDAVAVTETHNGKPHFFLLRYAGDFATERGGILRAVFNLLYTKPDTSSTLVDVADDMETVHTVNMETDGTDVAETADRSRPVPFIAGYGNLVLRPFGGDGIQTGQWHKIDTLGQNSCAMLAYLNTAEAQILRNLVSDGRDVIYLELFLVYRGLVAGIPWLIRADSERLNAHMQAQLGTDPAGIDHIVAAFLSLPEGVLTWSFIGDADNTAAEPTRDTMHIEAAHHALNFLFEQVDRSDFISPPHYRYTLRDSTLSPKFNYTLSNYRQEERTHTISWSISDLFERLTLPDRDKLFPTVRQISPFAQVTIHIINSLPFDPGFLGGLTVDVKNIGSQGIFKNRSFQFAAASEQAAQFSTFLPVHTSDLELQYRITAFLAPPSPVDWPVVVQRDFVACEGLVIDINSRTAGIEFVHLSADDAVFAKVSTIDITLTLPDGDESLVAVRLTIDKPVIWVALPDITPQTSLHITCRAHPPVDLEAKPFTLYDDLLVERKVSIHAHQVEVLDADEITVTLDVQASKQYPFVAFNITSDMETDNGILRTLEPGRAYTWRILRRSVFTPLVYRFRLHVVARDEDGNTLPMSVTDWIAASAHQHNLDAASIKEYLMPP